MSKSSWKDYIELREEPSCLGSDINIFYFIWRGTKEPVWREDYWRSKINATAWIVDNSNWRAKVDEQFEKEFFK